jgi:hypothetical protein
VQRDCNVTLMYVVIPKLSIRVMLGERHFVVSVVE